MNQNPNGNASASQLKEFLVIPKQKYNELLETANLNLNQVKQYVQETEKGQKEQLDAVQSEYNKEQSVREEQESYFNNKLLPYVSKNVQRNFARTFDCLVTTGRFSLNRGSGEILIDDLLFRGSNIISIITYLLRRPAHNGQSKTKQAPIAMDDVLKLLVTTVFPSHMILCPKLKHKFETMRQSYHS